MVNRLGSLQFDPLEVPGARNHDLVLHARIDGYRRGWCEQWLYGHDRRLIELYNKSLNILPMGELPHYALAWERATSYYRDRILHEQSAIADAILDRIRADGPLSTASFAEHGHAIDWWWAPTRAARAVMEALFVTGRLGIARRDGNRRYYDLIERLVPAELLARRVTVADSIRHRLLSRYRGVGLIGPAPNAELIAGTGTAAERGAMTAELVAEGTLLEIAIEGLKGPYRMLADERPVLDDGLQASEWPPAVTFLAPLDPFLWDRRLLRTLFGFDYIWEVYVPAAKRRHGYYVLPVLFGDRLVGRFEPRHERSTRTLRVLGLTFEPGFTPLEDPRFLDALAEALDAYLAFVGARTATWPRTAALSALARAIRPRLTTRREVVRRPAARRATLSGESGRPARAAG